MEDTRQFVIQEPGNHSVKTAGKALADGTGDCNACILLLYWRE